MQVHTYSRQFVKPNDVSVNNRYTKLKYLQSFVAKTSRTVNMESSSR